MNWSGHWHGFGPWTGTRNELGNEYLRRPGTSPDDEQTQDFLASPLPPMMTGHALLRHHQASPERTWTDVREAVNWLATNYTDRPPHFTPSALYATPGDMLRSKVKSAEEYLPLGSDVTWAYYGRNGAYVSYEVVCCPGNFHPAVPCPRPPVMNLSP